MNADDKTVIRVFMGIPLSPEVRRYVADIAQDLSKQVPDVRWVAPEKLHVTLKFIGNCGNDMLGRLIEVMKKAPFYLPLTLKVGGIGGFPSQGSARVIWVGAEDEEKKINELYRALEKGTEKLGFASEKRHYKPHITLGRAKKRPVKLPAGIGSMGGTGVVLEVGDVVLFRSLLKRTGAEYSVIERVGVKDNFEREGERFGKTEFS